MASDIDISNLALSLIGSDANISSLTGDGTVESGHCARLLPRAKLELLDAHPWTFAKKRALLAELDTNPSDNWAYAYQLPSDCISPVRVLQGTDWGVSNWWWPPTGTGACITADDLALSSERGAAAYEVEGTTLLTNEPEATLIYTADPVSYGLLSATFATTLANLLAAYLCGPLIKGAAGVDAASKLRMLVFGPNGKSGLAGRAAALDSNKSREPGRHVPDHIRARA
jgi:hypothetical protein